MTYALNTEFPSQETVDATLATAQAAEAHAVALAAQRKQLAKDATGVASRTAQDELAAQETGAKAAATTAYAAHAALVAMRAAGTTYRATSPTIEERQAAEDDLKAKTKKMKDTANVLGSAEGLLMAASAEGRPMAEYSRDVAKVADDHAAAEFRVAKKHLTDTRERMELAEKVYEAAVKAAAPADLNVEGGSYAPAAGTGTPAAPPSSTAGTPSKPGGPSKPAESAEKPAPAAAPAPGAAAKPGAGTPAAPGTGAKPSDTAGKPDTSSADLASLLAKMQSQQGQSQAAPTGQQAAPTTTPQAAPTGTGSKPDGDPQADPTINGGRPLDSAAIAAALNLPLSEFNRAGAPTPAPTTTPHAAPAPAAAAARLAGPLPVAPTTGSSVTNVTTGQDVSGRSSPAPGAGAYAPGTTTSGAHGSSGTTPATTQTGRTAGSGLPMGPMMAPPMGAGPAGGTGGERKPIKVTQVDPQVDILNAVSTVMEAVPGGTVGQRRD